MDRLHVATRKGLFRYGRTGEGWQLEGPPAFLAQPVTAVLEDARDGTILVALNLGHFGVKLHRSSDDGATWEELAPPAYPASDEADAPALQMIWTFTPGGSDRPGTIWAGTLPGGLFVSRDRGDSWTLVESLWNVPQRARWFGGGYDWPGIHSILIDPRDSDRMCLGVSCGGVWRSDDGGATWWQGGQGLRADFLPPEMATDPTSQDPHHLSMSAADPDRVWCQHHCGIFVSRDFGATFKEIDSARPSAFGFAVIADPNDPDTALFAPAIKDEARVPVDAKLVVTRTRDAGKSFESLDGGLPQGPSYDLIYRHALVADPSGARLAMGSTTGNLWLSEDGGARWASLSMTLPPIAQVAFA